MNINDEIKAWRGKPMELVAFLTDSIDKDEGLFPQVIALLLSGSDVEKGTAAEIMQQVSKNKPELLLPHIDVLVEYINYKAPRVKWGVPESIGNLAQKYPSQVEKAIPKLLLNTKDKGTVVRWCAAYALSEIAKNNLQARNALVQQIETIVKEEQNNGVRNVYLKTLKNMKK